MAQKKKIPVLRFPEFKDDWKKNTIENLFEFKNGLNKEKEFFGKGTPIINFTDVFTQNALLTSNVRGLVEVTQKEIANYSAKKGDVFFMRTSETINEIGLSATLMENIKDCVFSGFVLRARPKDGSLVNEYKKYCFEVASVRKEIIKRSSYTTRALTSGTLLNKVVFYYPSALNEQKKIASFLTEIDEKLQVLKKKKSLLEQYKKGIMQKVFSQQLRFKDNDGKEFPKWEMKKLGEFAPLQRGFDLLVDQVKPGKYPVVFSNGVLKHHAEYKAKGPGVVTGRSGTIGKVTYVEQDYWPHNTSLWVTDFKGNNPKFVFYFYSYYGLERLGTGSGVPTLNRNDVHMQEEILPPSNQEQTKIATFLSAIDDKISHCKGQIEKTEQYKRGLLQKMFV